MKKREVLLAKKNGVLERVYADEIAARIKTRYTISDEISLLRQRDEKPEEFQEYFAFVEGVKADVKALISEYLGEEYK